MKKIVWLGLLLYGLATVTPLVSSNKYGSCPDYSDFNLVCLPGHAKITLTNAQCPALAYLKRVETGEIKQEKNIFKCPHIMSYLQEKAKNKSK